MSSTPGFEVHFGGTFKYLLFIYIYIFDKWDRVLLSGPRDNLNLDGISL